jgi:hypothetical protein
MQGRVGTCLEDDVAFGVKDESAHIGDDCAATVDDAGHRLDAHVPVVHGDVVTATRCRKLRRAKHGRRASERLANQGRAMRRGPTWGPFSCHCGLDCQLPVSLGFLRRG